MHDYSKMNCWCFWCWLGSGQGWAGQIGVTSILGLLFLCAYLIGGKIGQDDLKKEAIKAGVAVEEPAPTPKGGFQWKKPVSQY